MRRNLHRGRLEAASGRSGLVVRYARAVRALLRARQLKVVERELATNTITIRPVDDRIVTNPSVLLDGESLLVVVREVNYIKHRRSAATIFRPGWEHYHSKTWCYRFNWHFAQLGEPRPLGIAAGSDLVGETGLEDPRAFRWRDETWCIWATGQRVLDAYGQYTSGLVMGTIDNHGLEVHFALPSPHGRTSEKNWMPFVADDIPHFLYDLSHMEIYRLDGQGLLKVHGHPEALDQLVGHSGSSQLIPWDEDWLCVSHVTTRNAPVPGISTSLYVHHFVLIDRDWKLKAVSPGFVFTGPGVEFCAGVARVDDRLILSYGRNDAEARLTELPTSAVESLLGLCAEGR